MPTIHYFLSNRHAGTVTLHSAGTPHSIAYCCQACGEVWFRASVTADDGRQVGWEFLPIPCEKHTAQGSNDRGKLPGRILQTPFRRQDLPIMDWSRALETLPPVLLQRELNLLLQELEND